MKKTHQTKKTWQRARSPEQRQERIDSILAAAGRLLDDGGVEATGINAIAREAGLSKPGLYRYFESREAILLELCLAEVGAWSAAFTRRLRRYEGTEDVRAVARTYADVLVKHPRLCVLLVSLATVLEQNVTVETVADFKRAFMAHAQPATEALVAVLPALDEDEAFRAIGTLMMAASGMYPHAHPSPVVEEVLAMPEFEGLAFEFKPSMEELARAYLNGLLAETR